MNTKKRFLGLVLLVAMLFKLLAACQANSPEEAGEVDQLPPLDNPALKAKLEAGEALRIMPLGDSITEGFCDQPDHCISAEDTIFPHDGYGIKACASNRNIENPGLKGYREYLRERLVSVGVPMSYVGSVQVVAGLAHEGHGGFNLFDLDYCVHRAGWLEGGKPDIILLHAGTNNAVGGDSPEMMIANLKRFLFRIYRMVPETTEVILAQVIPVREDVHVKWDASQPLANEVLTEYNAAIPEIAEEFRAAGKHVSWVDMQGVVQSPEEYDEQGLHPNPVAHERMAQVWFEKIMEILGQ